MYLTYLPFFAKCDWCLTTDDRHGVLWVSLLVNFHALHLSQTLKVLLAAHGRTRHYNPDIKDRFAPLEEATGIHAEFYPALGGYRER